MTIEEFWSKVNKTDGCWLWTAGCTNNGYGQFMDGGKKYATHRFSWELHFGPIPQGQCVLHKCDVRRCVRSDHLFLGDRRDNSHDALAKGRLGPQRETFMRLWREKWGGVRCGENIHCSKLTAPQVVCMRKLYVAKGEGVTCEILGKLFNVSLRSAYDAVMRKTWKHIA